MKHFIIESTYLVPLETLDGTVAEHRAFLQTGYDRGLLLASGPQEPRTGGIIIGRAASKAEIEQFMSGDPFQQRQMARYRFTEFNPVKFQPFLKDWVAAA